MNKANESSTNLMMAKLLSMCSSQDATVWLSQAQLAELFQVKPQSVTMHLKNIYGEGELLQEATCKDFLQVQQEGNRQVDRKRKSYNLDAIISVGYRIHLYPGVEEKAASPLYFVIKDYPFTDGNNVEQVWS